MSIFDTWNEAIRKRQREKYDKMMDQQARQLFAAFKDIQKNTCSCGECYSTRTIEWHTYSDDDLEYFAAWADQQFIWDSDDLELHDFADKCRDMITDISRAAARQSFHRLKSMF